MSTEKSFSNDIIKEEKVSQGDKEILIDNKGEEKKNLENSEQVKEGKDKAKNEGKISTKKEEPKELTQEPLKIPKPQEGNYTMLEMKIKELTETVAQKDIMLTKANEEIKKLKDLLMKNNIGYEEDDDSKKNERGKEKPNDEHE